MLSLASETRSYTVPYVGTTYTCSYDTDYEFQDPSGGRHALGRTTSVAYPDSGTATTTCSGQCWTVTDPKPSTRTMCNDALGRLGQVTDDPSGLDYVTTYAYTYPASNNYGLVMSVSQGSQTRTFSYDSLSRLVSATNPESGATSYTDVTSNGGLCNGDPSSPCTRTDARSVTTTYSFDALDRVLSKSCSDGTPTANFGYDESALTLGSWINPSLAYPNGRLTHTTVSGSTLLTATVQDYDPMGRTQNYWQCTPRSVSQDVCLETGFWIPASRDRLFRSQLPENPFNLAF